MSTPREEKQWEERKRPYSFRLSNGTRQWIDENIPLMSRSAWLEAAILFCIANVNDEGSKGGFKAFQAGLYCGFCKGTVYAREETEPSIDDATRRLWTAFSQEIAESPPRHWNAPMPERMMSQIRRPLGEILGADTAAGSSAGRRMNMGIGVRHPGETKD